MLDFIRFKRVVKTPTAGKNAENSKITSIPIDG
jgi:hypothetical protein